MESAIKPKCLKSGDVVGIVAPSSPPFEEGQIEFAHRWLEKLGLKAKLGRHIFDRQGDRAGSDEVRLNEFNEMWADAEVAALMPVRGGNGAVRILPYIDFELIKANPKILIGFSDITALLLAIHQKTNLVTFHGPTAGSFFQSQYSHEHFVKALMKTDPIGTITSPPGQEGFSPDYPPSGLAIARGKARGRLTGGCLTLVKQLMGTPYEIQCEGKIVFLEDVNEEPFAIDRMLTQLLLAGKLQKAEGIIFGESVGCKPGESNRRSLPLNYSLERVLKERLATLGIPVAYGLRIGHGREKITLPLGVMAKLEVLDSGSVVFAIEESATL